MCRFLLYAGIAALVYRQKGGLDVVILAFRQEE
jgi:hypothetical protein